MKNRKLLVNALRGGIMALLDEGSFSEYDLLWNMMPVISEWIKRSFLATGSLSGQELFSGSCSDLCPRFHSCRRLSGSYACKKNHKDNGSRP